MRRPRVLLDVDGVLADFLTPSLAIFQRLTGHPYTHGDFKTWDIFETIPREHESAYYEVVNVPGWCRSLPVYEGAQAGVQALKEVADLYIVTSPLSRHPTWTHEREGWLHEHFGIHHRKIVHTSAKYLCIGDVFVDDRPDHIEAWEAEHAGGLGLLWDQPYNRGSKAGFRVLDWNQVKFCVSNLRGSVADSFLFLEDLRSGKLSW